MSATHSRRKPVKTVEQEAIEAGLILRLNAAADACEQIETMLNALPCSDWASGRAEGDAIAAVRAVEAALSRLRIVLQIRLGWPTVSEQAIAPEPLPLPELEPPITDAEDAAWDAAWRIRVDKVDDGPVEF